MAPTQTTQHIDAPRYLVLDAEGTLHGYERLDVLLCDVAMNRSKGMAPTALYEVQAGLTIRYTPTTYEALRAAYTAQR